MPHATDKDRIRSLAAMARALGRSDTLFRILEIAAEEARAAIDAASVSVSRCAIGTMAIQTLVNVGELGPSEVRWPENETYPMSAVGKFSGDTGTLETWRFSVDDPEAPKYERDLLADLEKSYSLVAPIVVDGRLWGEFYATRDASATMFDDEDVACLEVLVAVMAGAISRSLREASLEDMAYRDPLTGLFNRRVLDEAAEAAFEIEYGSTRHVTVVTFDINWLKQINDTLGHDAGDQLIQSIAQTLQKRFDRLVGSVVARVGGDEFTVLVSGHDPQRVMQIADHICSMTWPFGPGASVSGGAATGLVVPGGRLTPTELFAAADRAQYVAKRARLARTVLADDISA